MKLPFIEVGACNTNDTSKDVRGVKVPTITMKDDISEDKAFYNHTQSNIQNYLAKMLGSYKIAKNTGWF